MTKIIDEARVTQLSAKITELEDKLKGKSWGAATTAGLIWIDELRRERDRIEQGLPPSPHNAGLPYPDKEPMPLQISVMTDAGLRVLDVGSLMSKTRVVPSEAALTTAYDSFILGMQTTGQVREALRDVLIEFLNKPVDTPRTTRIVENGMPA